MLTFKTIQSLTHGNWISEPVNPDAVLRGGAFDTRSPGDADIFFAWKGEFSDGHEHLPKLAGSGIKLIIVEHEVPTVTGIAMLNVNSSLKALHVLANHLVTEFKGKVVTITGSSGKTTTKEWLRHIINGHRTLLTNVGSFNNHIGCPITILNLKADHEVLLLEMGTSGAGEIERLASIAPADIALLLNVGHAHLGKFGSLDAIYQAKLELFSHLKPGSISLLPFFDDRLRTASVSGDKQTFGKGSPAYSWNRVDLDPAKRTQTIQFNTPFGQKTVIVPRLGEYVGNLLSGIIAVCFHLGLTWDQIESGLMVLPQEKGRSTFINGLNDVLILDDTYNANPESVIGMLETICSLKMKRTIGVIGNLAELDTDLVESTAYMIAHFPKPVSILFLSGETGRILSQAFNKHFPDLDSRYVESLPELAERLSAFLDSQTVIGVKGSRTSHMERLVSALCGYTSECRLTRCPKLIMCKHCDQF